MNEKGFTLIELLVTISIVSILSAVALNHFAMYKENAFNATATSDLRNGITAQEAIYPENQIYITCADPVTCEAALPGLLITRDNNGAPALSIFNFNGDADQFSGNSRHANGSLTFNWSSLNGVMTESP